MFSSRQGHRHVLAIAAAATLFLGLGGGAARAQTEPGAVQPLAPSIPAVPSSPAPVATAAGTSGDSILLKHSDANRGGRLSVNPFTGLVTTTASNYTPLTGEERWKLYWKQNYASVGAYFGPVFDALLLDQTSNSPERWGGGFHGYGLRVASRAGNEIAEGTVQAPLAALLHEDVRYIASSDHGGKRLLHALAYGFVTYNASGHATPNLAYLGAYYASTAVSTLWLPGKRDVARYTLTNGSEQLAVAMPVIVVQEYWPEIRHKVFHKPLN